ncbi:hypothetical protein KR038_000167, partial [Drosophila bunnanda]
IKGLKVGSAAPSDPETLDGIVRALFPRGSPVISEVSDEVIRLGRSVRPKKAPRSDAVPNRALKLTIALHQREFATMCLKEGTFPERWKRQKLLLLFKPGEPSSDTTGKVFEKIVSARLTAEIQESGGLCPSQLLRCGTTVAGLADYVAMIVMANDAIRSIEAWLASAGLELPAHMTKAVLISSRTVVETSEIRVGGAVMRSQRAIKYLGVLIDTRLSFREHLE